MHRWFMKPKVFPKSMYKMHIYWWVSFVSSKDESGI